METQKCEIFSKSSKLNSVRTPSFRMWYAEKRNRGSIGRGDSSHLGVTPRTPLFEWKKPENQKTVITNLPLERVGY